MPRLTPAQPQADAEAIRTTTLNPFAYGQLADLGIIGRMATQPTPIHRIEVSDERLRPRPGFAIEDRLLGWDNAEAPLAHTARNLDLVTAARAEVAASP